MVRLRWLCAAYEADHPVLRSFRLPLQATPDGVPDVSLVRHLNCQEMDSFGYGSANPLRNAAKTIRTLVNDRREYLVGIALLLIVVFLWALSNFVTQVRYNSFPPHAPLTISLRGVGYLPRRLRETILVRPGHHPAETETIDLFVTITLIPCRFQGYMVKHERVRCVPHTNRVEEVVRKRVTRCTSQWCVHCLVMDHHHLGFLILGSYHRATWEWVREAGR